MSRLIFRNLPSTLTPETFKSQLLNPTNLKSTTITDTKLVPKRRFAFVGYKTEEEAKKAQEWFDGTFVFGGGKVKVEFVRDDPLSKEDAPRKDKKDKTKKDRSDKHEPAGDDPAAAGPSEPSKRLQEFMDVMQGVDPVVASSSKDIEGAVPGEAGWKADGQPGSSKDIPKKEKPSRKGKERSVEPEPAVVADEDDDAAWLRKRKTAVMETNGDGTDGTSIPQDPDTQLLLSTGRLFIRNLAFVTTSEDLSTLFGVHGVIEECHLPVSKIGEPLGTAFIQYRIPEDAVKAWRKLDKQTFQGRLLHIIPGRAKPGQEKVVGSGVAPNGGDVLGKTKLGRGEVKEQIDSKRKDVSTRGVNWASLYMNSDAVAASVADRMGVSKSELLAGDDSNAAVKLAMAETTVIAETKQYFEEAGIVLESLSPKIPRSQTTILVKNIPYGTTLSTLTDLFAPHGEIKRILLPPSGTLGVVEFEYSHEAGKAFRALAYRRLGNAVLYLEKGPVGMFKENAATIKGALAETTNRLAEKMAEVESAPAAMAEGPNEEDESGSTLFLKNLAFATNTERLISVLSTLPGFSYARVQTKPDPKRPGERLSMGYGFVGFKTRQAATKAMGGLAGFEIDGKNVEVKFANRGIEEVERDNAEKGKSGTLASKDKGTKVLVKNLPFEATKKDVRELFSAYGQLKSLRVPKKSSLTSGGANAARGFAFLEFTTHSEAVRAMEALKHTHLLGRHLVMEWAREGEGVDVDALREKVGRDRMDGGERKRRKLDLQGSAAVDEMDGLEV